MWRMQEDLCRDDDRIFEGASEKKEGSKKGCGEDLGVNPNKTWI